MQHYVAYQDTHHRGLRNIQNNPQTAKNIYKWQGNGRYLLKKGSKEMANVTKTVKVHQVSYVSDTPPFIFLVIKHSMKLVRTPTAEENRTLLS